MYYAHVDNSLNKSLYILTTQVNTFINCFDGLNGFTWKKKKKKKIQGYKQQTHTKTSGKPQVEFKMTIVYVTCFTEGKDKFNVQFTMCYFLYTHVLWKQLI